MRLIIPLVILLSPTPAISASMTGSGLTPAQAKSQLAQMGIELSANKLIDFAAQGDQNTVTLLLAAGLSPSASDSVRRVTALHNAASQGHVELVRLLLSMQAKVDARDWQGVTPLIYAAYAGKHEVLALLLEKGASINRVPMIGPTPLNAAVLSGNLIAVRVLLDHGAALALKDVNGHTARQIAERAGRSDIVVLLQSSQKVSQ